MGAMKRIVRRAIPATAAVAGLGVTAVALPVRSIEKGADDWAANLSANERQEYISADGLKQLPRAYRTALIKSSKTLDERAAIWRTALDNYMHDHSVTPAQEAVLIKVRRALTPDLFDVSRNRDEKRKLVTALHAELRASLGEDAALQLLRWAGPEQVSDSTLPLKERLLLGARRLQPRRLTAAMGYLMPTLSAVNCNCSDDGDCYYFQVCRSPFSCDYYDPGIPGFGCGDYNLYACLHLCSYSGT
jgi:hypothetical protein